MVETTLTHLSSGRKYNPQEILASNTDAKKSHQVHIHIWEFTTFEYQQSFKSVGNSLQDVT